MSNSSQAPMAVPSGYYAPPTRRALNKSEAERPVQQLRALADPVRLRLVSMVAAHQGGQVCVCDLTEGFDLSQPTISHHLKVLHEVGLLNRSKRGVWVYYGIESAALAQLSALIADPTA